MADDKGPLDVYLAHRSALVDYAAPIVGCPARAEDVVQEAYLRYAPAVQGGIDNPVAYLYRIVRNLALDLRRSLAPTYRQTDGGLLAEHLVSTAPTPEQHALQQDELRAVAEALQELPVRTRLAFELYRFDGLTLQQIALQLDVSVSYVHQLVRIAMSHCAERLADTDDADD